MTDADRRRLLARFNGNPPAGEDAVHKYESALGALVPNEYFEFLKDMNGGEGFVGDAYVILWRLEELIEMNEGYQVPEYAPGLFLFGSDGGGEGFAFDTRVTSKPIVEVPFVGMDVKLARPMGSDFREFLEKLFRS